MSTECPASSAFKSEHVKRRWIVSLRAAGAAAVLLLAVMPSGSAQPATPARPAHAPSPAEQAASNTRIVLILARSVLLALADANATGNYTVLRDLGSPAFQVANTAAHLSEIFSNLRAQRLDLSQVAVLVPQLTIPAQRDNKGRLRIEGSFPSTPEIAFLLLFEPEAGQWRLFGASVNPSQPAPSPQPASLADQAPGNNLGVLVLIRSTLLALADANATGNYTVLRDLGAPSFRAVNTAARLSEIFAKLREQRLDLSQLAVLDPKLTTTPQLDAAGMLHIEGAIPSTTPRITFSLVFQAVGGEWRLFGISLNTGQPASVSAPRSHNVAVSHPQPPKSEGK